MTGDGAAVPRDRRAVRDALAVLGVRPSRSRGQNFLVDAGACERIVAAAEARPGDLVLEVGPGLGALTAPLLATGAAVLAVELDGRFAANLVRTLSGAGRLRVLAADVLDGRGGLAPEVGAALREERPAAPGRFLVAANLPYSVATPFLVAILDGAEPPDGAVVMVQREVAERIRASPGSAAYGPLSVLVQDRARVETLFRLRPGAFHPPPAVESTVLRLRPRDGGATDPARRAALRTVVHAAFGLRRKTLANAMTGGGIERASALLAAAGIEPARRAESLDLDEFRALARALVAAAGGAPPAGGSPAPGGAAPP